MSTGRVPATGSSPLTTKGDLYTYSTTQARLAVGNNGETLVADSSASTGLRWQGNFAAGKNKIINGDFRINQRGFSSTTTTSTYGFDRFTLITAGDGTSTYSAETFTAGAAPVAGYEAINFARLVTTGQTTSAVRTTLNQFIEDVRTFAGETVTVSFWAKANSGTPKVAVELRQDFGSGGSTAVNTLGGQVTLSTSWARYSVTVAVPSISGKTIGTSSTLVLLLYVSAGSDFNARTGTLGIQTNTFDFWGVQVEAGNVATAFQTATGTLAGELAACQRYYYRSTPGAAYGLHCQGFGESTTVAMVNFKVPVTLRVLAASVDYSNIRVTDGTSGFAATAVTLFQSGGMDMVQLRVTVASGLTQYRPYFIDNNNNTAGYLAVSAEL